MQAMRQKLPTSTPAWETSRWWKGWEQREGPRVKENKKWERESRWKAYMGMVLKGTERIESTDFAACVRFTITSMRKNGNDTKISVQIGWTPAGTKVKSSSDFTKCTQSEIIYILPFVNSKPLEVYNQAHTRWLLWLLFLISRMVFSCAYIIAKGLSNDR